jgi:hypothetical protein
MAKDKDVEAQRKREKIQAQFWSQVGSAEQVRLMQSEGRVRVVEKSKVWVNQPEGA